MEIHEITLKIKDYASIYIYTNFETIKNKLTCEGTSLKRTIPITSVSYKKIDINHIKYQDSIFIIDDVKKNMHYSKEANVAFLYSTEDLFRFADLIYIALSMFSKILSDDNKFLLHSSALMDSNNNGIVLVGDANAGKTSLAYELISKYDYKLVSNDHSVIGIENNDVKILGGTKEIQMRVGALELYFNDLYKKINLNPVDKWKERCVINNFISNQLISDDKNDICQLTDVYNISTSNSTESFISKKEKVDQFLFLYESFSKILKGSYNYITGFDYPMPSLETNDKLKNLSDLCKHITENGEVYSASGSVKGLAREIVRKYAR